MNGLTEVRGMIIKVMQAGEYDRRITLLTKERGKISVWARGARRQNSPLMGITAVFATGTFMLFEGRDSYSLQSARIDNYFSELQSDVEKACYGTYFMELADYYAREFMSEPQMLELLYTSLLALGRPSIPDRLVRRVYELRLMVTGGEYEEEPAEGSSDGLRYTWKHIITSPISRLYTFVLSDEVMVELEANVDRLLDRFIDRHMNSLEILEMLTGDNT